MPFYDGADSDVIPVYESSYQFQGYFIQAYEKLNNLQCSHYLFIGDDVIINPKFDEYNFTKLTAIQTGGGYYKLKFLTTKFIPLNSPNSFRWFWAAGSSTPFFNNSTSYKNSIPTYEEALSRFDKFFGVKYKEFYTEDFFGDPNEPCNTCIGSSNNVQKFIMLLNHFLATNGGIFKIPYPMARGYSDIFCIEKSGLFEFARLCGIFSAMNMFAEIAIPTAAVLTFDRNEVEFFPPDSRKVFWDNDRIAFEEKYSSDFNRLCSEWNPSTIYVHPVKLSKWTMKV